MIKYLLFLLQYLMLNVILYKVRREGMAWRLLRYRHL